ncbi:UNVERIFIED_CONTAM: hypothetical protein FKN15_065095 [Acipenser sinensis]
MEARNYTEEFAPIPLSDDSSVEDTEETVIGNLSPEGPSLHDILQFASGLSSIPPSGFHPRPSVEFLHNGSPYPIADTCGNIIHLPITTDYYTFQKNMDFGILNSPGFGRV